MTKISINYNYFFINQVIIKNTLLLKIYIMRINCSIPCEILYDN